MERGTLSRGALWTRKGNSRPCKLARGMMNTSDRSGHGSRLSDDANKLAVYGTCDTLAGMFRRRKLRAGFREAQPAELIVESPAATQEGAAD